MAKVSYLYRGPATRIADSTPRQGAERMAASGAWLEKIGPALVDVGRPFGSSASVRDDGTEGLPATWSPPRPGRRAPAT